MLQVCFQQVDWLLEQAESPSNFSDITGAVDVIMGPENTILQVGFSGRRYIHVVIIEDGFEIIVE